MVDVTVSARLRDLYRKATGSTAPRERAALPPMRTSKSVLQAVPEMMPAQPLRIMSPGRRAVKFDGLLLCSGSSDGRTGRGYFQLYIYQKTDQTFLIKVNRVEQAGDERLVLTADTQTIHDVRETLEGFDPARGIPFGQATGASGTHPIDNLQNIATFLADTRAEYRDLISSLLAKSAKTEERPDL
jgi:hypothetical protein